MKTVLLSPVLVGTVGLFAFDFSIWLLAHAVIPPVTNDIHVIFVSLGIHLDGSGNCEGSFDQQHHMQNRYLFEILFLWCI